MPENAELLFFDTFAHDVTKEINLDLIQFKKTVSISEIRIIPLGSKVQAHFPGGGVRLGATNPSKFSIEFFVNNVNIQGASTFQELGSLEYDQNGTIRLEVKEKNIPTDGLILKGLYNTITLAVYGSTVNLQTHQSSLPSKPTTVLGKSESSDLKATADELTKLHSEVFKEKSSIVKDVACEDDVIDYTNTKRENIRENKNDDVTVECKATDSDKMNNEPLSSSATVKRELDNEDTADNVGDNKRKRLCTEEIRTEKSSRLRSKSDEKESIATNKNKSKERNRIKETRRRNDDKNHKEECKERVKSVDKIKTSQKHRTRSNDYHHLKSDGGSNSGDSNSDYLKNSPSTTRSNNSSQKDKSEIRSSVSKKKSGKTTRPDTRSKSKRSKQPTESINSEPPSIEDKRDDGMEVVSEEEINYEEIDKENNDTEFENSKDESTPISLPDNCEKLVLGQLEPILSTSSEDDLDSVTDSENLEDVLEDVIPLFDPFTYEVQPISYHRNPCLTEYEWSLLQLEDDDLSYARDDDYNKYKDILSKDYELSFAENEEGWVQDMESIITIVKKCLLRSPERSVCSSMEVCLQNTPRFLTFDYIKIRKLSDTNMHDIKRLIRSVDIGLNFDIAYNQSKPAYKIRHIKIGIVLTDILCQCGEQITLRLIDEVDIQKRLLTLFTTKHMNLSIKMLILRALDTSLQYGPSVQLFLTNGARGNGYQRLIKLLQNCRLIRIRYSITNILRKIHLFEVLQVVRETVAAANKPESVDNGKISKLELCFEEVTRYLRNARSLISQPARFLPIRAQFEYPRLYRDPYQSIYNYLNYSDILNALLYVISASSPSSSSSCSEDGSALFCSLVPSVSELIVELSESASGMIFLASSGERARLSNCLIKLLLQSVSGVDLDGTVPSQLGLNVVHRLYVLNQMDNLRLCIKTLSRSDDWTVDSVEVLDVLHNLYCLSLAPIGKYAVAHVLDRGDIAEPLFRLLKLAGYVEGQHKRSPVKGYIADLLAIVLKYADDVAPFLQRYVNELRVYSTIKELDRVKNWLYPLANVQSAFAYEDVSQLCEHLKNTADISYTLPEELISTVQILCHLAICNDQRSEQQQETVELKYRYTVIQLFSNDALNSLTTILRKICDHFDKPYLYSSLFSGHVGESMLSLLVPTLKLIRVLLMHLIECRNVEFKDLTAVDALMRTNCLLYAVPSSSPEIHSKVSYASREIIEALLAYTHPAAIRTSTGDGAGCSGVLLNDNVWSLMMSKVLKFTIDSPDVFVPSLTIVSELLPLPLPLQTQIPLSDCSFVLGHRKLWSAHLMPCESELQQLVRTLCFSSHQPLLHLLRKICVQLADLSAHTASVIVRNMLAVLTSTANGNVNSTLDRLLNFFENLIVEPTIKMTFIHLSAAHDEQSAIDFWTMVNDVIRKPSEDDVNRSQESILNIFHYMCDYRICLCPSSSVSYDQQLANSMPSKEMLSSLCYSMMEHLANNVQSVLQTTTVLSCLRISILLLEHDFGFYHVKTAIENYPGLLYNLLASLVENWRTENDKQDDENSLRITILACTVQLLRESLFPDDNPVSVFPRRTAALTASELSSLLKWESSSKIGEEAESSVVHPLFRLRSLANDLAKDSEHLKTLCKHLNEIIELLEGSGSPEQQPSILSAEPFVPAADPLLVQFSTRIVENFEDPHLDRLSTDYWLGVQSTVDDCDKVTVDLTEVIRELSPSFDFEDKLKDLRSTCVDSDFKTTVRLTCVAEKQSGLKPPSPIIVNPTITAQSKSFSSHRSSDSFRNRVPNSSRAPSMHVDDFVALETHGDAAAIAYSPIRCSHPELLLSAQLHDVRLRSFDSSHQLQFRSRVPHWYPHLTGKIPPRPIRPPVIRSNEFLRFNLGLRWPPPRQIRGPIHRHIRPFQPL